MHSYENESGKADTIDFQHLETAQPVEEAGITEELDGPQQPVFYKGFSSAESD